MRVRLENIGHVFDGSAALFDDLSHDFLPGHKYALVGPSGSGKSTLLSIIAGWVPPTAGKVTLDDVERICWVFQNPHGVASRTALDHVVLPLLAQGLRRAAADAKALELMASVDLAHIAERRFRELSGGEAQRLMLVRAIAARPDVLLVDEPTAQLDPRTAASVNGTLQQISADGTIIIVATHDPRTRDACTDILDLEMISR